jgi:hypothetical protein
MKMDEIYKLIGYGLVCLLIIYIVTKSIRFQLGVVEGLVGRKKENSPTTDELDESEEPEAL